MSGPIPVKDVKILCTRSGNRCANPVCRRELVIDNTSEGDKESLAAQIAHIKGEKPNAPRYDENMTDVERNSYSNLILLCNNCHKEIDDQPKKYTVEKLLEMKCNHEDWVIRSTEQEIVNVTFSELDIVTKYLISDKSTPEESYILIPPKKKIKKNELSASTERLITMGLTQVKQVGKFIDESPDLEFGKRLRNGFITKYEQLRNEENMTGDDLFNELIEFASGSSKNTKEKAAGLTVLVYLFEKCEVFEK